MKTLFIIALLSIHLMAQNPSIFSSLGDTIYDNSTHIEKLKNIDTYSAYSSKIDDYMRDVKDSKQYGFNVKNESDKKSYLNKLRELSFTNDFFIKSIESSFKKSLKKQSSKLFLESVNSNLLDVHKYKSEIMSYYNQHKSEINPQGTIQNLIDEDKKTQKKELRKKSDKLLEEERIARIRKSDKLNEEEIQHSLEEDVLKKKILINEEKNRELGK